MAPSSALPSAAASTLRPARAAQRYRKGQAPAGYAQQEEDDDDDDDDDDEDEEDEEADASAQGVANRRRQQAAAAAAALKQQQAARRDGLQIISPSNGQAAPATHQARQIKVEVKTDPDAVLAAAKLKQEEESSSGEEEESEEEAAAPKPAYRPPGAAGAAPAGRPVAVKQEEEETSSGEEESSSEEEEAPRPAPLYKPMFVSKRVRDLTAPAKDQAVGSVGVVLDEEAAEMKRQAELEERRRQSTFLASESIKRELAGKETEDRLGLSKTDDTDGVDPEGEFEAWKLRELMRIKREKEAGAARSAEREALEARRALPEALRLKEDTEHAAATRAAKAANRGQQGFLQKYHHKGAFFADDEILQRYDYSAPTEGETIRDVSSLPKVMQVRNYGKMGRTKYTHLADQDTSDRSAGWGAKPGQLGAGGRQGANSLGQGCFHCGGNHRKAECPELANAGPSGANASSLAPRQRRRSRSQSSRSNGRSYDERRSGNGESSSSYRPPDSARDSGRGRDGGDRDRSYAREDAYEGRSGRDDHARRDEGRRESYRRRSRSRSRSRSPRGGRDRDDKRRRRD